jgi:hypothetical protein
MELHINHLFHMINTIKELTLLFMKENVNIYITKKNLNKITMNGLERELH